MNMCSYCFRYSQFFHAHTYKVFSPKEVELKATDPYELDPPQLNQDIEL